MIYDSEIDKETWAFIEKTKSFYSDELLSYSIEQQRLEYNQMCRAFDTHRQYELIIKTEEWDTIPVRIYEPQNSMGTLIYFHGGGFVVGDLDSHHDVCANLAEKSQLRVVSVAYSLRRGPPRWAAIPRKDRAPTTPSSPPNPCHR